MKNILSDLKPAALLGLLFILPLITLELINQPNSRIEFPAALFIILWLLPVIFIATLMPILHKARAGENILAHPISLLIRVIILFLVTWMWSNILLDQIPCFIGIPNCD